MTPEDVLAQTADLIEFSGRWTNGQPSLRDKTVCLRWAVWEVAGFYTPLGHEALAAIEREVRGPENTGGSTVLFNDALGRTAIEVATALRNAKRWLVQTEDHA